MCRSDDDDGLCILNAGGVVAGRNPSPVARGRCTMMAGKIMTGAFEDMQAQIPYFAHGLPRL